LPQKLLHPPDGFAIVAGPKGELLHKSSGNSMLDISQLREAAEKCRRRADNLSDDAETLRRFGQELAELAERIERNQRKGSFEPTSRLSTRRPAVRFRWQERRRLRFAGKDRIE
jgi:hypothetical protein